MTATVTRYISYFHKSGEDESLVGEIPLSSRVDVARLQKLFGLESDNPLYDCYPIDESVSEYFSTEFKIEFDFEKFEYLLECNSED